MPTDREIVDAPKRPSASEFLRAFTDNWFVAMAGVISVVAMILGPLFAATKVIEVAALFGFIFAAYGVWSQERKGRLEEYERWLEAQRVIDAKRARVEPELRYEDDFSGNLHAVTLYCTNIGEWAAREVSVRIFGNTLSPMTFEVIQLLTKGARVAPRPFFAEGRSGSISGALASLALAQAVGAHITDPDQWIRGHPPLYHPDIVLVLDYVDTQTGMSVSDTFVFESIEAMSGIPIDHRWVVRRRAVTP